MAKNQLLFVLMISICIVQCYTMSLEALPAQNGKSNSLARSNFDNDLIDPEMEGKHLQKLVIGFFRDQNDTGGYTGGMGTIYMTGKRNPYDKEGIRFR
ncbi:hypothetical protein BLOT_009118 [Blomia tropicalis]|nr:hypothetical protein BLOT_009118 [Blomia tropicalis]